AMRSLRTGWTPSFGRKRLEGSNWLPGPTLNGHLPYSLRFAGRKITIARLLAATTRQQKGRQTEARRPRLIPKALQLSNLLVTASPAVTRFPPWNRRSPVLRERGFSYARNLHRPSFAKTEFKRGPNKSLLLGCRSKGSRSSAPRASCAP